MTCSDPDLYTQLTLAQQTAENTADDLLHDYYTLQRWEASPDVAPVLAALDQARAMLTHVIRLAETAKDAL